MSAKPPPSNLKQITRGLLVTFALVIAVTLFIREYGHTILRNTFRMGRDYEMQRFDETFKERFDFHTFTNTAHALMARPWSEAKTNAIKQFQASLPQMPQCLPPRVYLEEEADGSKQHLVVFYMVGLVAYDIVVVTSDVTQIDLERTNESRINKPRRPMATNVFLYRLNI